MVQSALQQQPLVLTSSLCFKVRGRGISKFRGAEVSGIPWRHLPTGATEGQLEEGVGSGDTNTTVRRYCLRFDRDGATHQPILWGKPALTESQQHGRAGRQAGQGSAGRGSLKL